mmetsp:Transcript_21150/g.46400  ORF Transcript_21150/g.46400 Transcript_21150/m.46400 type:complete len:219 (+) Transcript_21150:234-890(+)
MWYSSLSLSTISPVMPLKQNMPIWSVTCCQGRVEPEASSSARSDERMVMMRSAMPFTSLYHRDFSSGSPSTVETIKAPCRGGLEYMGRAIMRIWLFTGEVWFLSFITRLKQPTRWPYRPMFLAYDWEQPSSWPSSKKMLIAWASLTQSPEAKPWYAMSKKGKWFFSFITEEISFHWSAFGSTPVGLCAHACNRKKEPLGAVLMSSIRPSKSRPLVSGL